MREKVFQILYCSRNNIRGTDAEVKAQLNKILRNSRTNNARAAITGALFYNTVFFAQVLEGTFEGVQRTFERLQLDTRHADLVVLRSGFVNGRDFGDWAMAFAGVSADIELPLSSTGLSRAVASECGAEVLSFLRDVVTKQEAWALPHRPSRTRPAASAIAVAS